MLVLRHFFNSFQVKEKAFVLFSILVFSSLNLIYPLLISYEAIHQQGFTLTLLVFCWGFFAFLCIAQLEILLRDKILEKMSIVLNKNIFSLFAWEEVESVHITGVIEKYIWSLSDSLKSLGAMAVNLILMFLLSKLSLLLSLIFFITISFLIYYKIRFVHKVRLDIVRSNILVMRKVANTIKLNSKDKFPVGNELQVLAINKSKMIIWRTFIKFLSNIFGFSLVCVGLILMKSGNIIGTFFILTGFEVVKEIEKLIDSFVVLQGELIHFYKLKLDEGL